MHRQHKQLLPSSYSIHVIRIQFVWHIQPHYIFLSIQWKKRRYIELWRIYKASSVYAIQHKFCNNFKNSLLFIFIVDLKINVFIENYEKSVCTMYICKLKCANLFSILKWKYAWRENTFLQELKKKSFNCSWISKIISN